MRYLIILTLSLLSTQINFAQINEIGVFVGGSNLIGDVGPTKFIAPNTPSLGLLYKWNRSRRHSYRFSVIYSDLKAKDSDSDDPRRIQRDYSIDSNLLEISAGMEFTFMDFNLHSGETIGTPYLFSGIAATQYSLTSFSNGSQSGKDWTMAIPMAIGYKTNILGNFILGFEVGARYTFTDNIDGSFPESSNNQQYQFGNINNNDWYTFTGITLTYTFGIKPCYCYD
ncbi:MULTISPECIES: DUF6089 family protein [unclassified Algibacter]|uniref:type IX secretion system protein PorG n=1 Tax=unclassified Algibacter TaxID=2615009 RepID=UPI00131C8782|nr:MULTISPECIES: DUF6089 family protein [unclassified Algibacter]MCL5129067.1 DUF6089 family protein [Algibacter sp. L4_22]